jgi:hypothetical protein
VIGGAYAWLADALSGLTSASSARITLALGLLVAALYARRVTSIGAIVSSWVTVVAVVLVVLAAGIVSGALTPDLSLLTDAVGMVLEAVRDALR